MREWIAILLLLLCGKVLLCQQTRERSISEELSEAILSYLENTVSEDAVNEEMVADLLAYYQMLMVSPLDINRADREDLESLIILTDFQICSILDYRKEYGLFLSVNELFQIPGIDHDLASLLIRFVTAGQKAKPAKISLASLFTDGKSQVLFRAKSILEQQQGYRPISRDEFEKKPDSRYLGSKMTLYSQYKFAFSDRLQMCATLEKDAGERGVDYKSLNLSFNNVGILEKLVIGDYAARFGQGLVLWNSLSLNSATDPKSFKKTVSGIVPYNSTDENLSLRGIAATMEKGRVKFSLFGSQRAYDARIHDGKYTSLIKTGLHNTVTSLERKGSLGCSLLGMNLSYSVDKFRVSGNAILYKYNHPYGGRDTLRHSKEMVAGGYSTNAGVDFYWVMDKIRLFGELAADRSASLAGLVGVLFSVNGKMELALLCRDYSNCYNAPYASLDKGEKISLSYYMGKYWKACLGFESRRDFHNLAATLNFDKGKEKTKYYFNLSNSSKRTSIRNSICYPVTQWLKFADRVDVAFTGGSKINIGSHLYHEIMCETVSKKISGSFRIAAFNVPIWDVRIYSYEKDMLYGFSIPACYGKGIRYYLNIHYSPLNCLDFWAKISSTHYLDRDKIGEGPEMIGGPSVSEAKIQIRWMF